MKMRIGPCIVVLVVLAFVACNKTPPTYDWNLPAATPRPVVPVDNPMNTAKVQLGRWLFYDVRLSVTGAMSCATCHIQELAFTDGRATSIGATGERHPRSSMSLINSAYVSRLTWANPLLDRLEDQALTPLFGDHPVEMGLVSYPDAVGALLRAEPSYAALAKQAFPGVREPYSVLSGVRAIAAFVRTLISFDAPYDHYLAGDENAMSTSAIRGMDLFFSEKVECFHCHGGFNFSDSSIHENVSRKDADIESIGFHNTGLYNLDGQGAYPSQNTGLYDMTGERRDMGRFRAPSLRNIALTAPYMHDGSLPTLSDVLDHYSRGGRQITSGPNRGDGRLSPFKSEFIKGFEITAAERDDLIAFLNALTDPGITGNIAWSDPFAAEK